MASILRYAGNVGRSAAYALPQIIKGRLPSVHALTSQFTDKGQRENTVDAFREMKGILKEDVLGLMRKGLDNANKELKSGKFHQTEAEQNASFDSSMGFDAGAFDNSFLEEHGSTNAADSGTARVAAAAAAEGASAGVAAAAARMGDSPAARVGAQASVATAKFSRASLGAQMAVGNMLKGAIMANAQVLSQMHKFQVTTQHQFYRQQLEHNMAMAGMTSELISQIRDLRSSSNVAAAASDQIMQAFTGKQSDFSRVFDSKGGMDVGAYLGVINSRFKKSVGDGSMFKMMGNSIAAAPLAAAFSRTLEALIPKNFGKQLEQFNDFASKLGTVLNQRARHVAGGLRGSNSAGKRGLGKVLEFFSIDAPTSAAGPDLSRQVRGKAVAFDGYAHRSIVEVIPSHLADIHAELVAQRRAKGIADPTDRKLYDFKTGRFSSEKASRQAHEKRVDRESIAHFDRVHRAIGDGGDRQTAADLKEAFKVLRNDQFSVKKGSSADLGGQIDSLAQRLRTQGKGAEADKLLKARDKIVKAREKHGARFSYELQTAVNRSDASRSKAYDGIENEEGVHRMMYSGGIYDAESQRDGGRLDIGGGRGRGGRGGNRRRRGGPGPGPAPSGNPLDSVLPTGDAQGFEKGASDQKLFRDATGKITLKSILQTPMVLASKAMNTLETKISGVLFGDGTGQRAGLFTRMNRMLMGDVDPTTGRRTGPLGRMVDFVKKDIFGPLKKAMVGDPSDPASQATSIVGTTKRWFREAVDSGKKFLFGDRTEAEDGTVTRKGGLFGGVVNYFSGKSKQLKDYLLGKGDDGKNPGLLVNLKEKFTGMVDRMNKSLFGTKDADGRRSGGVFGDGIQKGKDFMVSLWDKFQEKAVQPLGKLLFGEVGADGKRSGGAFGSAWQKGKDFVSNLGAQVSTSIIKPMQVALFGKGTTVDDGFGNVTYKGRGIFPTLGDTLKTSVIAPMMTSLFGEKQYKGMDASGKPIFKRQGGAFGMLGQSLKDAFAPLKNTFVGPDGIWTSLKKGVKDTFADLKVAIFGEAKEGEGSLADRIGAKISDGIKRVGDWMQDKLKPVTEWIQKGGDWLKTKVFEPFGKWLNDPKSGFIVRMREGTASFFYGKKNADSGMREGGLFGAVKKQMDHFFYGNPDKGTKGFVERVVEPAKKFVLEEIWNPLKTKVSDMWDGTKQFFKDEILSPLKGVMEPFVTEAKEQWRLLKEWVKGPLWETVKGVGAQIDGVFKNTFGTGLSEMLRKNVLDPIKDALSSVQKFLGTALKSVLKLPVNILRGAADELKASQIRRGIAGGMSQAERERIIREKGIDPATIPAGSGSSLRNRAAPGVAGANPASPGGPAGPGGSAAPGVRSAGGPQSVAAGSPGYTAPGVAGSAAAPGGVRQAGAAGAPSVSGGGHGSVGSPSHPDSGSATMAKPHDIDKAIIATADNTHNIYQFVSKHLWGVGKNVERIVDHFKIQDIATGGNSSDRRPSGLLGKLRKLITNPLGFVRDVVTGAFDYMRKAVSKVFDAAKGLIMVPIKGLIKGFELLNKTFGVMRKMFGEMAGMAKDLIVNTLGGAAKVAGTILRETAKATSTAFVSITKAIPAVVSSITSASVSILKAGGQILGAAAKIVGSIATTLVKMAGAMITTAVKVTKDIVTGLARITFDAIGTVVGTITGRGKKNARGKLTPVYVVGGYLAGTTGGAKSLEEAEAGGGIRKAVNRVTGAIGDAVDKVKNGFQAVKDRMSAKDTVTNDGKWKARLLSAGEKSREALAGIGSGIKSFGSFLMSAIPMVISGIGALVSFFTQGKFISMLGSLLKGNVGGMLKGGAGMVMDAGKGLVGKMGGLKGVGLAAGAGLIGTGVNALADNYMDEGVGKKIVKTGGTALQYGAMGATIGSVIPGVGTAVGAGVGAAIGAVVENWDDIAKAAKALGEMMWSLPKKILGFYEDAGKFLLDGIKAIPGMLLDGLKAMVGLGSQAADGVKSAASSAWDWISGGSSSDAPVENRAEGGPLGSKATMVGELGPEVLNRRGEVISGGRQGGKFSNPSLVKAAQGREDSVSEILRRISTNTLYSARALEAIVNGSGFGPLEDDDSVEFKPLKNVRRPSNSGGGGGSSSGGIMDNIGELGRTIGQGASSVGHAAFGAAKNVGSKIMSGDFSGAASSAWSGLKSVGSAIGQAGSAIGQTSIGSAITGSGSEGQKALMDAAVKAGITSPTEQAMFLAQMDTESGGFRKLSESFAYSPDRLAAVFPKYFKSPADAAQVVQQGPEAIAEKVYGGRMGNKDQGDGFKYRGRGYIQLTGKANYEAAGKALGIDLVGSPDLAADPATAAAIATWFWKSHGISGPASKGDVAGTTKIINGGENGLSDRQAKYTGYLAKLQQAPTGGTAEANPLKTAMLGGWMGDSPTLVGERQPEVLSPDGQIHPSVDAYLSSSSADPSSLAVNTAVKEAVRRSGAGPDNAGANDAMSKIAAAAGGGGMAPEAMELFTKMLEALNAVANNTAGISNLVAAAPQANSPVGIDASKQTKNVFTLGSAAPRGDGMSPMMERLAVG